MKTDGDYVILSSGRSFYANGDVLGLGFEESEENLRANGLLYGCDGGEVGPVQADGDTERPKFTPEERREIAEHMINAWKKWGGI